MSRRSDRARRRIEELDGDDEDFAAYFKERVYASFTGLAIVLVLAGTAHPTPGHSILVLALGVIGITAAGFASDVVVHLTLHQEFPRTRLGILLRVAGGALGTAVGPVVLLGLSALGVFSVDAALTGSAIVYIATLVVVGWLAVRRSRLTWVQQLVALLILAALGLGVVALQTLAHSVGEH